MGPGRTRIVVAVCTHRRNEQLGRLLDSLAPAAERVADRADVGVVVVDDNPDGRARRVVSDDDRRFSLGLHYRHSGARNISVARNLAVDTAAELGDWVAMVDDDEVMPVGWLDALLTTADRTGATAVTGPIDPVLPPGTPTWFTEEGFLDKLERTRPADEAPVDLGHTGNSLVSAAFLRSHPELRFDPDLGRTGGEDVVFFRRAVDAGLVIHFAEGARLEDPLPPERLTFRYQLSRSWWLGNTRTVTNLRLGTASRPALVRVAAGLVVRHWGRVGGALLRRRRPPWRFAVAATAQAAGLLVGVAGVELRHR